MPWERETGRLSVRPGLTDRKVQAEELITEAPEKIHHVKTEILNSGPYQVSIRQASVFTAVREPELCSHRGWGSVLGYRNPRTKTPHSQVLYSSGGDGGECGRGKWESYAYVHTKDK